MDRTTVESNNETYWMIHSHGGNHNPEKKYYDENVAIQDATDYAKSHSPNDFRVVRYEKKLIGVAQFGFCEA